MRRGNINNKCHPSQLTSNGQTFCGGGCKYKYKYKYKNKGRYNTRILYGCKSLSPVFLTLKGCTSASGQYSQFLLSLTLWYQVSGIMWEGRSDSGLNPQNFKRTVDRTLDIVFHTTISSQFLIFQTRAHGKLLRSTCSIKTH